MIPCPSSRSSSAAYSSTMTTPRKSLTLRTQRRQVEAAAAVAAVVAVAVSVATIILLGLRTSSSERPSSLLLLLGAANGFSVPLPSSSLRVADHHHHNRGRSRATTTTTTTAASSSSSPGSSPLLRALIYGWDDNEDDDPDPLAKKRNKGGSGSNSNSNAPLLYTTSDSKATPRSFFGSTVAAAECTTAGMYIAEHLTCDRDQMGSLAKLAFAFRGPEHSNLKLDDIESVHVLCVRETAMELEAILCENQGCVSLHIPITFPTSCTANLDGPSSDQFQTCVLQNLELLNNNVVAVTTATSSSSSSSSQSLQATGAKSGDAVEMKLGNNDSVSAAASPAQQLPQLSATLDKASFPSWWVVPTADDMVEECDSMKEILNEDDFASDLVALAQDGLRHSNQQQHQQTQHSNSNLLRVVKARCGAVGPAGIGLKVLATTTTATDNNSNDGAASVVTTTTVMDVLYPFGGPAAQSVQALRAAVLGAVAVAAEQNQAAAAVAAVTAASATATGGASTSTSASATATATSAPTTTATTATSTQPQKEQQQQPQPQPGNPPFW